MKGRYPVPHDLPAAACGRCMWFKIFDQSGNGHCLISGEPRWYKCMVCPEYEFDPNVWRKSE